ncbi:MAG: hypothetical protein ACYSWP_20405 [Planctomycetota bacterium]|jgi:hypothetical protein
MNESTETPRRRLKWRPEILALVVSVGSLIIAAASFYFSSFYSVDKLTLNCVGWKMNRKHHIKVRQVYANGGTNTVAILSSRLDIFPIGDIKLKKGSKEYRAFSLCNWSKLSDSAQIPEWQSSAVRLGPGDIKVIDANYRAKKLERGKSFGACIQTSFMTQDGTTHWAGAPGIVLGIFKSGGFRIQPMSKGSTDLTLHAEISEKERKKKD